MLNEQQRESLKQLAERSIEYGIEHGAAPPVDLDDYDADMQQQAATFVTLKKHGQLRGCIGMLKPVRPLVEDVAENAFAAAFRDSRFQPLQAEELPALDIHISILGQPQALPCDSEQDLLTQLRHGEDGLILRDGMHRATFLPSVWESIDNKAEFLQHLKRKAGLPADYWSDDIAFERYSVEEF